jgi:hypothetical protein
VIEATGLRTLENAAGLIDPAILVRRSTTTGSRNRGGLRRRRESGL